MAQITRSNPFLEEIIDILQHHLESYGGDENKAREKLSKADSDWIDQELLHCITEPRYFISNYYAIKTEDKGYSGLYPLWDSQEILHDEFRKMERLYGKVRAIVLKARQMGSTTYIGAEIFQHTIFKEHTNSIIVAQDADQSRFIMDMYSSALDFLPWWMRPRIRYNEAGKRIVFDEKDDALRQVRPGLKTAIYADNGNKPSGAGRGKSFVYSHLSEISFWNEGSQLTKSLFPTMNALDGFYVMESTANGRNDFWHNLWRRAEAGKIDWHPIFIPFYRRDKTYSMPIADKKNFVLTRDEVAMKDRIKLKENYIVRDEVFNWRRHKIEEFIASDGDDVMFSQEYASNAEEAFQSSSIMAFPRGIVNKLAKQTIDPLWIGEIKYDAALNKPRTFMTKVEPGDVVAYPEMEDRFHVWEMPVVGEKYAVGTDVSLGNAGGDYSVVQVVKLSSGHQKDEQVACWHGLINPYDLAEVVVAIGWMYNEGMVAVEVNSIGQETNSKVVRDYEYENVYRFKRLDRLKNFQTDIIGFWTDYKSKRALMAKMSNTLLEDGLIIRDKHTIDEFYDFTEDGAEGKGAKDDLVMALMIALYCGHEGEIRDQEEGKSKPAGESSLIFEIKNRFGAVIQTTTSQAEAQRVSKREIGSSIVKTSNEAGTVMLAGKKFKVPIDRQNSEYSPIYDGEGSARQLFEDGHAPEDINSELIAEYEAQLEAAEDDANAWLYS